jgi:hypothetical protein
MQDDSSQIHMWTDQNSVTLCGVTERQFPLHGMPSESAGAQSTWDSTVSSTGGSRVSQYGLTGRARHSHQLPPRDYMLSCHSHLVASCCCMAARGTHVALLGKQHVGGMSWIHCSQIWLPRCLQTCHIESCSNCHPRLLRRPGNTGSEIVESTASGV